MADQLSVDTKAEASATPAKDLRRWLLEIKLAEKREKDWRQIGRAIIGTYRGTRRKKNSFNILWSNTEVLRPALYNSTPKPDVRRRFRQKDALGKAVAEVAERSLTYCVDAYDLDDCLTNDVLDALLPGRGISRVRYIPKIKTVNDPASPAPESADAGDAFQGTHEEVEYEQALCDHVQWDDFLHGPGKTWQEVQWVGFCHNLTKDAQIEKFGEEIANAVTLDDMADDELKSRSLSDQEREAFKTARFWEIWDKDGEKVFFVNGSYKKSVIYPKGGEGEPPLKLKNFFPCPRPLMMVEDTGTLIPTPLYEEYREQAEELNDLSTRINKIIKACKIRFVFDPTLSELKSLMDSNDNDGIPAENARAWMANGGLEKAIWWMPVDQIARVLKELYEARAQCKEAIYEITGISDIIRGATNPNETLGAQKLKANSSSLRLQRMQREVQRYVRDLIRLLAEVVGENFDPQTLAKMTGLQFPTAAQKQQIQLMVQAGQQQMQQASQQAQASGQPPPQPPPEIQQKLQQAQQTLSMPSWEDIMAVLKSDMQREYRVDVETDSTVAESLHQDMEGLREVMTSVVELFTGLAPAVQAGALTMEAAKAMVMSVVRRARMGLEVEDALESGMQEPKPQADPKAAAEAAKQAQAQQQAQHDQMLARQQQAHEQQMAQRSQAHEEQVAQRQQMHEEQVAQREAALKKYEIEAKASADQNLAMINAAVSRFEALLDSVTKIETTEMTNNTTLKAAQHKAATEGASVQ